MYLRWDWDDLRWIWDDFKGDWGVNGWKMGEMFGGMGNFAYFCGGDFDVFLIMILF